MNLQHAAEAVRQKGRDEDTMLIHMTPSEVGGLQALAMAHGGSLTINPETGLPEANFLKAILPTVLGAGLSLIPGVGPLMAAGIVGGVEGLRTGDLGKGLMAGLGAYGGAGIGQSLTTAGASSLTPAGVGANAATNAMKAGVDPTIANAMAQTSGTAAMNAVAPAGLTAAYAAPAATTMGNFGAMQEGAGNVLGLTGTRAAQTAARAGLKGALGGPMGIALKAAPIVARMAETPQMPMPGDEKSNYDGPYLPTPRQVSFPTGRAPGDSSEYMYFSDANPYPGFMSAPSTYASGGEVNLEDDSFVVDAKTTAELGDGSSSAGQEMLARFGGRPIKGPGTGVSDSIQARAGGTQEARVARDEVYMSPGAVKRFGGGSLARGHERLYAMMRAAENARRNTKRGEPTGLKDLLPARG